MILCRPRAPEFRTSLQVFGKLACSAPSIQSEFVLGLLNMNLTHDHEGHRHVLTPRAAWISRFETRCGSLMLAVRIGLGALFPDFECRTTKGCFCCTEREAVASTLKPCPLVYCCWSAAEVTSASMRSLKSTAPTASPCFSRIPRRCQDMHRAAF